MLKIGDFARLGQVSVRMLRNYDELGLLTPAHVDQWTNYRSYTADQLARLHPPSLTPTHPTCQNLTNL